MESVTLGAGPRFFQHVARGGSISQVVLCVSVGSTVVHMQSELDNTTCQQTTLMSLGFGASSQGCRIM
eukprot:1683691-Amphidinium_carterae.1